MPVPDFQKRPAPSSAPTPWRALSAERRIEIVTQAVKRHRDLRAGLVQRLVARGGGFRSVTLLSWPPERLAKEVVRLNAQATQDELDLLHLLYVELEPAIQITFLDAAGVKHADGVIDESLEAPFCDEAATRRAVAAVRSAHGAACEHYLTTILTYGADSWPGLASALER
ncbi:MAG: hypothetical protein HYR75_09105 [Gemmatimonadetes bacterium]|nr:hypothetical protein [Gemmatimonadota bacterium]MBI3567345.1 hypothetical protein [Gemmatimonadota bacterium]